MLKFGLVCPTPLEQTQFVCDLIQFPHKTKQINADKFQCFDQEKTATVLSTGNYVAIITIFVFFWGGGNWKGIMYLRPY